MTSEILPFRLRKRAAGQWRSCVRKDNFANAPFTIYTFRHTDGIRHWEAGTRLPVPAELMGDSKIETTMNQVHAAREQ